MPSSTRTETETNGELALNNAPDTMPAHMLAALRDSGVDLANVSVPHVSFHTKIEWEELCTFDTKDDRTKASPLLLVTDVKWQPEAEQRYDDYRGLVLVEFTTEFGDELYVTHAMTYAATGEYLPLSAWLKSIKTPAMCRFGHIETSKRGQFIMRPLPQNIEVS